MDVRPAPPAGQADLLGPQAQPGRIADQVPVAPLRALAVEGLLETEHVPVEAPGGLEVVHLEDELRDPADWRPPVHQSRA